MAVRALTLLALILSPLIAASPAHSRCAGEGFSVWPPPSEALPPKPLFVLTGQGRSRVAVEDAAAQVRLRDRRGKTVPIEILHIHKEGHQSSQVVFTPKAPLKAGQRYTLQAWRRSPRRVLRDRRWRKKGPGLFHAVHTHDASGARIKARWTVGEPLSGEAPTWRQQPTDQRIEQVRRGCGPVVGAGAGGEGVRIEAEGQGAVAYRITLTDPEGASQIAVVPPRAGKVMVGHGMCSGPFTLRPETAYTVTWAPIDAEGREGEAVETRLTP